MSGNQAAQDAEVQSHNSVMGQMQQIGISAEHLGDVQGINKYLQDHRINQLFNVSALSTFVLSAIAAVTHLLRILIIQTCL